ncbi:MAG: ParB N-terminal domain-containing protein, partial [Phycisphaerae bacterium]|nr:ParB N-terminal domain-containing protein [Phycisphaerae bacterium]
MAPTLTIQKVPIASLHVDPANARLHPEENLAAIEASLRRFGQAEPLIVQANTGRVIGGNGRLVVMQKLG